MAGVDFAQWSVASETHGACIVDVSTVVKVTWFSKKRRPVRYAMQHKYSLQEYFL
jgi:hypothetical protein